MKIYKKIMCTFTLAMLVCAVQAGNMGVTKRPLSDFLDAQGTASNFFPPVPDYVGWTDPVLGPELPPVTFALIDYAGLADQYLNNNDNGCDFTLGTTVTGSIKERVLPNGKAEIRVALHTKNAMGFAQLVQDIIDNEFDFNATDTIFGNKTLDVCDGAPAAVGQAKLDVTFTIENPGDPLPDLVALVDDLVGPTFDYRPVTLKFKATIFDGMNHLKVHQHAHASATDVDLVYTKEVVEIR